MLLDSANEVTQVGTVLIIAILAVSVFTDVRRCKIYNSVTFPAIAAGLVVNVWADGITGLLVAVSGFALGAVLFSLPVAFLRRGAGDLKLLAAIGAIGGPAFVLWVALFTGAAGLVFATGVLLRRRQFGVVLAGMALDAGSGRLPAAASNIRLPYAIPIATGAIATMVLL